MPHLVMREGTACVKDSFTLSNEPVRITNYWPVGVGSGYASDFDGAELFVCDHGFRGHYRLKIAPFSFVDIVLIDGGKTESIFREEEEIPKPKTRVETRYRNGRWEKYLKTRGWVSA